MKGVVQKSDSDDRDRGFGCSLHPLDAEVKSGCSLS